MGRGRPIAPLALDGAERETLEQWTRRPKTAQPLALRARIVLACADGRSNTGVAAELRVCVDTVGKWRSRFLEQRLDGLLDQPRSGRPRMIDDADVERVIALTLETTPKDATHWSTRSMARLSGLSHNTVSRIWRAFALQPHRTETFKLSADPLFIEVEGAEPSQHEADSGGLQEGGSASLAHGNRGSRPANATAETKMTDVVQLASTRYAGTNHTHLTELLEREGIDLSRSTVRGILVRAGVNTPRRRRPPRHRVRRRWIAGLRHRHAGSPRRERARWKAVQQAKLRGLSIRAIARVLGNHRNTVGKYAEAKGPPMMRTRGRSRAPQSDGMAAA